MNNHFYIQARMGSSRLPGKIMKKILDKTIIEIIVERLSFVKNKNEIFLITGAKEKNFELIEEAKRLGIEVFSGSENNILDRFYHASNQFQSESITRITGDCPLIDFQLIKYALEIFDCGRYDILSNNKNKTFPHGLDFEIFKKSSMDQIWRLEMKKNSDKNIFDQTFIPPTKLLLEDQKLSYYDLQNSEDNSKIRITLDYAEDFFVISKIFNHLYPKNPKFILKDILKFLSKNPEMLKVNNKFSHI